jgi:predicted nucleotidyltransferase
MKQYPANTPINIPTSIPTNVQGLIQDIVLRFHSLLEGNLVGIYLHGSLAMNCFNPSRSDVDFLVVVKQKLETEIKREIVYSLLELSKAAPAKGLEMSIVLQKEVENFRFPTPYELHFSNMWKEDYVMDRVDFERENTDPDLAAHFVITKERGICLIGQPIEGLFPEVPYRSYVDSIMFDVQDITTTISDDPVYGVLNLCRVLAFVRDGRITSKEEGGEWVLKKVDLDDINSEFGDLIQQVLEEYREGSGKHIPSFNYHILLDFSEYMMREIQDSSN